MQITDKLDSVSGKIWGVKNQGKTPVELYIYIYINILTPEYMCTRMSYALLCFRSGRSIDPQQQSCHSETMFSSQTPAQNQTIGVIVDDMQLSQQSVRGPDNVFPPSAPILPDYIEQQQNQNLHSVDDPPPPYPGPPEGESSV